MPGKALLLNYLAGFVTEERNRRFAEVLQNRTRHIVIGLENIYQPHNASAVLRSCDCFGIQDVHIIENENSYSVNPDVALGSEKWLTLHRYKMSECRLSSEQNTEKCIKELKKTGYAIAITSPRESMAAGAGRKHYLLDNLPLDNKTVLFFGTEMQGISSRLEGLSDFSVSIEMLGFTESFNISVAAAISMHTLSKRLRSENIPWQLTDFQKEDILLQWYRNSIPKAELLEKRFESGTI